MKRFTVLLLIMLFYSPANAEWALSVQDPWIRHLPGDRPMAGYFVAENQSNRDLELVGATSPAFEAIHIHQTVEQDGAMTMRPVDSVAVPAGGRVEFAPGGYHLMLMKRTRDLDVDDEVPIIFELGDGGDQSVLFTVKPAWQE